MDDRVGGHRDRPRGPAPERTDAPRVPETGSRRRPEDIGETWPDLPEWATPDALDADARRDLRGLSKENATWVAAHLVAASTLADDDPDTAWWHARAARARGGRIAVVRETVGLVAYRAGEWAEAIGELRAARRMGGGPGHLAVLADCERALGHPEKAIELSRSTQAAELDDDAGLELATVIAGARADLGQTDAALAHLEQFGADRIARHPRLAYAYADLLDRADRKPEALTWFIRAANADVDEDTDALDRVEALAESMGAQAAAPAAAETVPAAATETAIGATAETAIGATAETAIGATDEVGSGARRPVTDQEPVDPTPENPPDEPTDPTESLGDTDPDGPSERADPGQTVENDVTVDMTGVLFSDDPQAGDR